MAVSTWCRQKQKQVCRAAGPLGHLTDTNRIDCEWPELSESVAEHVRDRSAAGNVRFFEESIFTACLSKQTDKSSFHLTELVLAASGNAGMLLYFKQTSGRQQIQVFFSSSVLKTTYLSMWTWNDLKALKWEKSRKESVPFGPHPSVNKDLTKHCFAL